ncbi:hypothetical protein [Paenibacillus thermotolerans]|uniref:hypothetical protein n=1 Tax=Paenibacillus thermotolerans TaxID=3027807 RepID=UPI002368887C|nr:MULTISPECIES: hypothetical protein [unclassified Paenibacillus]
MKLSKKAVTLLSFTIGACVFVSTAFADMALGTGYDRLKDSAKHTAAQMENGLDSYTTEVLMTLKDNDRTMLQVSSVLKIDTENQAMEETTVTQESDGESKSNYSYSDRKLSVWKNSLDDKYYATGYPNARDDWGMFTSPFNQNGFTEMEKIFDAVVGNLKDHVQVEERTEGGRIYSGSLSEVQVPAIVNAVSSFGMKQIISDQRRSEQHSKLPEIESDIYVKRVTGTAVENKSGLLEQVTGSATLSGKDKDGVQHDMTLDIVFKLSNIGRTKVSAPDLTNAEVEKVNGQLGGFSSKYVGTYKNNIVIEKDGRFVKIGERIVEITSVADGKVTGKYQENVKPEYKTDYPNPYSFTFEYAPESSKPMSLFSYTNADGEKEFGSLHIGGNGNVYLELGIEVIDDNSYRSGMGRQYYDPQFDRVFE